MKIGGAPDVPRADPVSNKKGRRRQQEREANRRSLPAAYSRIGFSHVKSGTTGHYSPGSSRQASIMSTHSPIPNCPYQPAQPNQHPRARPTRPLLINDDTEAASIALARSQLPFPSQGRNLQRVPSLEREEAFMDHSTAKQRLSSSDMEDEHTAQRVREMYEANRRTADGQILNDYYDWGYMHNQDFLWKSVARREAERSMPRIYYDTLPAMPPRAMPPPPPPPPAEEKNPPVPAAGNKTTTAPAAAAAAKLDLGLNLDFSPEFKDDNDVARYTMAATASAPQDAAGKNNETPMPKKGYRTIWRTVPDVESNQSSGVVDHASSKPQDLPSVKPAPRGKSSRRAQARVGGGSGKTAPPTKDEDTEEWSILSPDEAEESVSEALDALGTDSWVVVGAGS